MHDREPLDPIDGSGAVKALAFVLLAAVAFVGCCWAATRWK
jgi:hypothetical protein